MRKIIGCVFGLFIALHGWAQLSIESNVQQACAPAGIVISVTSPDPATINSYQWTVTFPDNSVQTSNSEGYFDVFTDPGSYDVELTINGSETIVAQGFIEIYSVPEANFTTDINSGCFPLCINFTDQSNSTANIVEWSWDFGNGVTSSEQNPEYCYNEPGSFTPILSIENEFGCFSDISIPNLVDVFDEFPVAAFTPSTLADCNPPADITFENNSTGTGAITSNWSFDDGFEVTTVDATPVQHTFNAVDLYDVCLHVQDETGCEADSCITVEVFPAPLPQFTFESNVVCAEEQMLFISTTSPNPNSISWDIDGDGVSDGDSDTLVYAFAMEGQFNPTLTATYSPGCEATTAPDQLIDVLPALVPAFEADTTFGCAVPLTVNFTNNTTGPGILGYSWRVNGVEVSTDENYSHLFNNVGNYDVELVVTNDAGCERSIMFEDYVVINQATIDFNLPTVVCTEELVELTNFDIDSYDPVVTLEWDFDEDDLPDDIGENPNFIYNDPGEYVVSVAVTTQNGCYSEVESTETILVQPNAEAAISSGQTISCAGEPVEFCVDAVEGLNYNWNFGDNTGWSLIEYPINCIQHDYQDTGYFDITLSVYNLACGTQLVLEDYLYISGPVALFDAEEDCSSGTLVSFQSNSIEATGLIWDFGDGSPLVYDDEAPVHQYAQEGVYDVTLTATNPQVGCPDITNMTIDLVTDPIALNFQPNEGCPGMNVFVTSPDQTQYEYWNIDFGNGAVTEAQWNPLIDRWEATTTTPDTVIYREVSFNANFIPFINYSSQGYFDITINTVDWSGCPNSTTYEDAIYVYNDFYFADFDINVIEDCDSVHVEFVPTGDFLDTWEWQLTDGNIVNDYTFEYVFEAPYDTTFGATLLASDDFGCNNQVSNTVDIVPPPVPGFSVLSDPSCIGEAIELQNESLGENITFQWDFGDPASGAANTSNEQQPSHIYDTNGSYEVCLLTENTAGCVQTLCQPGLVNIISPEAAANYNSGINNCLYGVTFENTTQGNISSSVWDFGDNQSGFGLDVFHTYPIGVYDAELVVINEFGCSDTLLMPDILNLSNVVGPYSISLDNISCAPFQTSFEAFNTNDNTFTYFWEFDDGSGDASNVTQTTHTYDQPGEYCPSLIMEDNNGCPVFIQCETPFVVEEFTYEIVMPEAVCYGETHEVSASGADTYGWADPQGLTTTANGEWEGEFEQTASVALTGYYEDCQSTVDVEFVVNQLPQVSLPIQEEFCFQEPEIALDMGLPNAGGTGAYFIDDVSETTFDPSMNPAQTYEVVYTFTDDLGCFSADSVDVYIHPLPVVDFPDFDDQCVSNDLVNFNTATPVGGVYTWNTTEVTDFDPATGVDTYSFNYEFEDANGCINDDDAQMTVHPLPVPAFSMEDICYGNALPLNSESTIPDGAIQNTTWNLSNNQQLTGSNPAPTFLGNPGVYDVQLVVESTEGCVDSLMQSVQVLTSPEASFSLNDGCLDEEFDFLDETTVLGGTTENWMWMLDGQIISGDQNVEGFLFNDWGTYDLQLMVESNEGCVDSLTQSIDVFPMPELDFETDDFCADVLTNLSNLSTIDDGQITSYEWSAGDNTPVSGNQDFQHIYTQSGLYDITLSATSDQGCSEELTQQITVYSVPDISLGQDAFSDCGLERVNFEDFSTAEGSSIVNWNWTLNGEFISGISTATATVSEPGVYNVGLQVGTAQGCLADTLIEAAFEVYPIPEINYISAPSVITMLNPDVTIEDLTPGATGWQFIAPDGSESEESLIDFQFQEPGIYPFQLEVVNDFGCTDTTTIWIEVLQEILVHIPNSFTPDGDGLNEVFIPVFNELDFSEYTFEIYNRWGEVIFATSDPNTGWRGNVKGGNHYAQNDTYTYRLVLEEATLQETKEFTGHVTLIR